MPSPLLALICLTVVHRLRPQWVAIEVGLAAAAEGVSPQRLSRLCSKAIALFEHTVGCLTRIGRPPADTAPLAASSLGPPSDHEQATLRAMLDAATGILRQMSSRTPLLRQLVVGAYLRLRQQFPALTQQAICQALAVPVRTLRHWLHHPDNRLTDVTPATPAPAAPRTRPPRRPRFGFAVTIGDTQLAADTTDLAAFDVPLKLIAAQDVGGRDRALFDAVIVDDHESAELVAQVLTDAVADRPGMQVITDQGTPYMAQATRQALDDLEAEHAPQVEADPLGKATIERAFATVKHIARPLLDLTTRIARAIPALRRTDLAKAAATVLLTAMLKAYQAGARAAARADEQRAGVTTEDLAQAARRSRERARADDRSARLLLTAMHQDFQLARPLGSFIRSLRSFPVPVLQLTRQAFARQAHRDDIRDRASYVVGIAVRINDEYRRQMARRRAGQQALERIERHHREHDALLHQWRQRPEAHLRQALDAIAAQWQPHRGELLGGGAGAGHAWLIQAFDRLREMHEHHAAVDIAQATFRDFASVCRDQLGDPGITAVGRIFEKHLGQTVWD